MYKYIYICLCVDVIGLLTGKGDIIQFSQNGEPSNYIVIEVDDLE